MSFLEVGHSPGNIIFLVCLVISVVVFARLTMRLRRILLLAKPETATRTDGAGRRLRGVLYYAFGQARVIREPAGWGHFLIFWCFILLVIAYIEDFGRGLYHRFSYETALAALFGAGAGRTIYGFFMGVIDVLCLVVFVVLCVSLYRRYVQKPLRLTIDDPQARQQATIVIGLIMSLMVLTLLMHGLQGVMNPEFARQWMPVGTLLTGLFSRETPAGIERTFTILWWVHALIILYFLTYLPRSKHMHLLWAMPNIYTRSFNTTDYLPPLNLEDEDAESFGVSRVEEYTWRQLLDGYACTECGRCQAQCPAYLTEKPLTPFGLIHHLKTHTIAKGNVLLAMKAAGEETGGGSPEAAASEETGAESAGTVADPTGVLAKTVIPEVISEDAVMACTTCGACMEECPVFIEHIPKIVDLRRYLVLTEGQISPEGQTALRNMETQSNPWGIGAHSRGEWAEKANVTLMSENSDVEYLYFVGCAGSFDERNKKVALAVAKILNAAGVSFAILGTEEGCCGDSARRLGNEYLFQMMAAANIETFDRYGVKKIITSCPHGFASLKHDYPQFGGNYEVYHHTELMADLLRQGRIKLTRAPSGFKRITYHDPCYLGRHNKLYAPARQVLDLIPGIERLEMAKNSRKSFCCGGGGGRMWLEETIGKRVNMERTEQALAVSPDRVAVACPFCMTMFDEGLKTKGVEETCDVLDVAEIVAAGMENGD